MQSKPTKVIECPECGDRFMVIGDSATIRLAFPRPLTSENREKRKCPKHSR
jgi:DNA-directed RNA polymerase subunit RPC12/RpoP